MRYIILIAILCIESILANYRILPSVRPKSAIDSLKKHNISDMYTIPQNTSFYVKQIISIPWSSQIKDANHYIYRFFQPWQKYSMNESTNALNWQFRFVRKRDIYGFNR